MMRSLALRCFVLLSATALGVAAEMRCREGDVRFEMTTAGRGSIQPGGEFGVAVFKSSDGVFVYLVEARFPSRGHAEEAFRRKLRGATQLTGRRPLFDACGRPSGERVVALFSADTTPAAQRAAVLWLDEAKLYHVYSASAWHVLAFDKTYRLY